MPQRAERSRGDGAGRRRAGRLFVWCSRPSEKDPARPLSAPVLPPPDRRGGDPLLLAAESVLLRRVQTVYVDGTSASGAGNRTGTAPARGRTARPRSRPLPRLHAALELHWPPRNWRPRTPGRAGRRPARLRPQPRPALPPLPAHRAAEHRGAVRGPGLRLPAAAAGAAVRAVRRGAHGVPRIALRAPGVPTVLGRIRLRGLPGLSPPDRRGRPLPEAGPCRRRRQGAGARPAAPAAPGHRPGRRRHRRGGHPAGPSHPAVPAGPRRPADAAAPHSGRPGPAAAGHPGPGDQGDGAGRAGARGAGRPVGAETADRAAHHRHRRTAAAHRALRR
ncbi:hypothetical protein SGRIM128S_05064 [Streptomyces griseomycini]